MNPEARPSFVPLAIVGLGALFPKADRAGAYWANIVKGRDCITEVPPTHWRAEDYFNADPKAPDLTYSRRGGFLEPVAFNPLEFGISPNNLEATDTSQLLGLYATAQALRDAGYDPDDKSWDRTRASVILGVTGTLELVIPLGARLGHPLWRRALQEAGVPQDQAEDVVQRIADGYVPWQENSFPGLLGNVVAGRIANRFDLGGTNCVVDAACASSLSALHLAALELSAGRSDMVITGGVDTFNDIFMFMCFSKTPALSPTGDARPFDAQGDGTILGEGVGIVVIKRLADAERDGNKIYAVIKGVGSSSDGRGNAIYAPKGDGQARALQEAYRVAGVAPATVELIEGHGTGTKVGDATELGALEKVFEGTDLRMAGTEARPTSPSGQVPQSWCAVGSVKSQIGHTKAAAGAAGLIKAALALHHRVLPPSIKAGTPLEAAIPGHSPFYLNVEKRPWAPRGNHPRRAGVSAFGFGGTNFHCVLEEYAPARPGVAWDGETQLLGYSAESPAALQAQLAAVKPDLAWNDLRDEAARARAAFKINDAWRALIVVQREKNGLAKALEQAAKLVEGAGKTSPYPSLHKGGMAQAPGVAATASEAQGGTASAVSAPASVAQGFWSTPDGVYVGAGAAAGKLALLFPGQGAQYANMLRDLACQFPEFVDVLGAADTAFEKANGAQGAHPFRLSDAIYPLPAFDEAARAAHELRLRDTRYAQPALGATSLGAYRILRRFGVAAEALAGHSFGEIMALHAAGAIDEAALHALACLRGRLMAEAGEGAGDHGAMLAVQAPLEAVQQALAEEKIDAVLANKNAPQQWVLSGATAEIEKAAAAFGRRNLRATRLPVSAAFHSPLMSAAEGPFRAALNATNFEAPKIPVYANRTGQPYPADAAQARELLATHLTNPVEFLASIQALHAAGMRTFVEVGAGARLTGLVKAILGDADYLALYLNGSNGKGSGEADLARVLAVLAARGHALDLSKWDEGHSPRDAKAAPALTIPICGANYRKPREKSKPALRPRPSPLTPARRELADTSLPQGERGTVFPSLPAFAPAASGDLAGLLLATQENMKAMMLLQEQTARLHQQFLDSQTDAQQSLQLLLGQQQRMAAGLPLEALALPIRGTGVAPVQEGTRSAPGAVGAQGRVPPSPLTTARRELADTSLPQGERGTAAGALEAALLEIVSDKTGYPKETLNLTMDLEADLGIDSIKRVEILSALQERFPQAKQFQSDELGALRTLQQIVAYAEVRGTGVAPVHEGTRSAPIAAGAQGRVPPSPLTPLPQGERGTTAGALEAALLEIVADKTGYPKETLNLTMDLEADLGIDSIKRVEILSALQERFPQAKQFQSDELGALRTLQQIIAYASQHGVAAALPPASTVAGTARGELGRAEARPTSPDSRPIATEVAAVEAKAPEARSAPAALMVARTPAELLETHVTLGPQEFETKEIVRAVERLVLSKVPLAASPSRDAAPLPKGAKVWVTDDDPELGAALLERLRELDYAAKLVSARSLEAGAIPEDLAGLVILSPRQSASGAGDAGDACLKLAFRLLRMAGPALRRTGTRTGAALLTVARLDGGFGMHGLNGGALPESGGLSGLAKTARHEWPEVRVKALDLAPEFTDAAAAAEGIANELLSSGPVEIGLSPTGRWTVELAPAPFGSHDPEQPIRAGDVVVISGGARGVTAEVSLALAKAFKPVLVLLGRSPEPAEEPDWLRGAETEAAVKQALATRANGGATPKLIEAEFRKIAANREIRYNLRRIEVAGGSAIYKSVDVRDAKAVRAVLAALREELGGIKGLIHAAGVLADRLIEDKTDEQFDAVYGTKVEGLRNLLAALQPNELKLLVLFSSTTGRYGRKGQADYAAANEVLNKTAQAEAKARPGCRVVAINWGPWEGGMVTPGLRKVFEKEGVGLIGLKAGAEYLVREICSNGERPVEVAVLARSGARPEAAALPAPTAPPAAKAPELSASSSRLATISNRGSAVMPAVPEPSMHVAFERELDLDRHPFLTSHVIDGRSVLPMSMAAEWLAQGALHQHPGMLFHGFNGLRIMKGIILSGSGGAGYRIRVLAGDASMDGDFLTTPVEIWGSAAGGAERLHARGEAVLAPKLPESQRLYGDPPTRPYEHSIEAVYSEFLFHGPALRGIQKITGCSEVGIAAEVRGAPPPGEWMKEPLRGTWVTDPLVLDCAFQMMILWSLERHDAGSLPNYVKRYRQYRRVFPKDGTRIVIHISKDRSHMAGAEIEFLDHDGRLVALMEGHECTIDSSLRQAFKKNLLGA
ncbi:MAG: SDR family NAD(P)-dependent oxidoreductase [Planctomycetes bacterium]|nr:SDR family NAD(P)-dependent oxidoreductase [Planctomycetota bacterium]